AVPATGCPAQGVSTRILSRKTLLPPTPPPNKSHKKPVQGLPTPRNRTRLVPAGNDKVRAAHSPFAGAVYSGVDTPAVCNCPVLLLPQVATVAQVLPPLAERSMMIWSLWLVL